MSKLKRATARTRRVAHRCAGGAAYGAGIAWWVTYGVVYTGFGVVFAGVTMVVTTMIWAACAVWGGE